MFLIIFVFFGQMFSWNGNDRLDPAELRRLLGSVGEPPLNGDEEIAVFGRGRQGLSWLQFVDRLLLT